MATIRSAPAGALLSKRDLRAQESHQRRIQQTRERARQERATIRARAKAQSATVELRSRRYVEQRTEVREARAGSVPSVSAAKPLVVASSLAAHRREVEQQRQAQARTKLRTVGSSGGSSIATPVIVKAKETTQPATNAIFLVLFTIFGLILFYLVASTPGATTGWFNTLSNGLHALSSTTPLFTANQQTSAGQGAATQGTQGTQ